MSKAIITIDDESEEGRINVNITFSPNYDMKNEESNPMVHRIGAHTMGIIGELMNNRQPRMSRRNRRG